MISQTLRRTLLCKSDRVSDTSCGCEKREQRREEINHRVRSVVELLMNHWIKSSFTVNCNFRPTHTEL